MMTHRRLTPAVLAICGLLALHAPVATAADTTVETTGAESTATTTGTTSETTADQDADTAVGLQGGEFAVPMAVIADEPATATPAVEDTTATPKRRTRRATTDTAPAAEPSAAAAAPAAEAPASEAASAPASAAPAAPTRVPDSEYDPDATITTDKDGYTVTVPKFVTPGQTITVTGTGWAKKTEMALKLRYQGEKDQWTQTFARATDILNHPKSKQPDPTLWVLMDSSEDGTFTTTFTIPKDLSAGEKFFVNVTQGLLDSADVPNITVNSQPMIIDRTPWVGHDDNVTCVTDLKFPRIEVSREIVDGKVNIKGQGWCNPISGSNIIAVKIDEAAISRLESNKVDANLTIWDYIVPDPATGDFDYDMPLPDGTTSGPLGSKPAFGDGAHTLRFLTGSIKEGDPVISLPFTGKRNTVFVKGEYKPLGIPETFLASKYIVDSKRNDVDIIDENDKTITLRVPGRKKGDYIYVAGFTEDGSRRVFWQSNFYQVDDRGRITIDRTVIPERYTKLNLTLQAGGLDDFGEVLGWTPWERDESETTGSGARATSGGKKSTKNTDDSSLTKQAADIQKEVTAFTKDVDKGTKLLVEMLGGGKKAATTAAGTTSGTDEVVEVVEYANQGNHAVAAPRAAASAPRAAAAGGAAAASVKAPAAGNASAAAKNSTPQPEHTPEQPVKHKGKLTPRNNGKFAAAVRDGLLTITTQAEPGSWVFAYLYNSEGAQPLGWTQVGDDHTIQVGIDGLEPGEWAVTAQDPAGELLGWAGLTIPDAAAADSLPAADEPVLVAQNAPLMGGTDWALIIAAIALVELVLIGVFMTGRRSKS
ncbi:hypothetical protein C1Y63_09310 [Corynebacterium sp. 13CS0277]|uniref:hypothetical protein n=1 Tax=Corynebacterium sp. 13CS0277 TaxID=2071994 RepID=UPI000D032A91|nr:hypothetical protein [Corynebacterium sp. 13CS0277]PRQ10828.1 hypothetical protein C1Y63_09310 [Corynebacterium sp. 13CS0277]